MKKTSKILITMLSLVVMFAVFAFSASAADLREEGGKKVLYLEWDSNEDIINDYLAWRDIEGYSDADEVVVEVMNDITFNKRIVFDNSMPITLVGKEQAGGGYPTLKRESGASINNTSIMTMVGSAKVTFDKIIIDGNGYTMDGNTLTPDTTSSRLMYMNQSAVFTIGKDAVLKNGWHNGTGAGVYVDANAVLNVYGTITANEGSSMDGVANHGVLNYYYVDGARIEGNNPANTNPANNFADDIGNGSDVAEKVVNVYYEEVSTLADLLAVNPNPVMTMRQVGTRNLIVRLAGDIVLDSTFTPPVLSYTAERTYSNTTKSGTMSFNYGIEGVLMDGGTYPTISASANGTWSDSPVGESSTEQSSHKATDMIHVGVNTKVKLTLKNLTIDVNDISGLRAIYVDIGSTLDMTNVTVTGGNSGKYGGAIFVEGTVNANDCTFTGNTGTYGGVFYLYKGVVNVNGGSIVENTAANRAAVAIVQSGTMNLTGVDVSKNSAPQSGAFHVFVYPGTLNIYEGTKIHDNSSGATGGAMRIINRGTVNMYGGAIYNNEAATSGGAIYMERNSASDGGNITFNMYGGAIYNNKANNGNGGAIYISSNPTSYKTVVNMYGGEIYGNTATKQGGAIRVTGEMNMYGGTIHDQVRSGGRGGAVWVYNGTFNMLKDTTGTSTTVPTITNCTSTYASAIDFERGTANLTYGLITGNTATAGYYGVVSPFTTLNLGGDIQIYGNNNSNCNAEINVRTESDSGSTGQILFTSDLTGKVGIYVASASEGKLIANVGNGVTFAGIKNLSVDTKDFYAKLTEDGTQLVLASGTEIHVISANDTTKYGTLGVTDTTLTYDMVASFAPEGYTADQFVGLVEVTGFGTKDATATKLYKIGSTVDPEANVYSVWVNVNTLTDASALISENTGIRFFTTVDSAVLEAVGIKVKAGNAEGDGYYRGTLLGTSATDLSTDLSKDNKKMDVKVNNTGWANAAAYGIELEEGSNAFAVSITYGSENYYNNAVAYRGYIEITVGETSFVIYSDFTNPGTLTDSADASYGDVHARSACAIVRNVYFSGDYPNEEELIAKIGEENYAIALKIAGYTEDFWATAAKIAYYL